MKLKLKPKPRNLKMKLIREEIETAKVTITEGKNGKKKPFYRGCILCKVRSKTAMVGCILLANSCNEKQLTTMKSYIEKGRALGELGHPDGPTINLDRVSHLITSLKQEGNNFVGKARLLDTPMGNIAKNLIDEGVKLGVSSRGLGSIKRKNGVKVVCDDFYARNCCRYCR